MKRLRGYYEVEKKGAKAFAITDKTKYVEIEAVEQAGRKGYVTDIVVVIAKG